MLQTLSPLSLPPAGHLPLKDNNRNRKYRSLVSTYLTFSPTGQELLVNLGGEQVYLFDLHNLKKPKAFSVGDYRLPENSNGVCKGEDKTFRGVFNKGLKLS